MNIASDTYEGWVGRFLIQQPCIWENNEGITAFDSDEEVDAHCMEQFIIDFGRRAYRRPLTADEVDDYMTRYRNVPLLYADEGLNRNQLFGRALRDIIAVINLSPEFLYRIEIPTPDGELGAYEIASRLSYHFWNTMPDDALFAAAADGRLLDADGYAEQVNRLFSDEKTDRSIREFYADYFRVHHIPDVNHQDGPNGNANVQYHTGPNNEVDHTYWNNSGNARSGIVEALSSEFVNLGRWFTHMNPGTFEDMFRSNLHFMECTTLWNETCFGAGPWSQSTYDIHGNCEDRDDCFQRQWVDVDIGWDGVSDPIELPGG